MRIVGLCSVRPTSIVAAKTISTPAAVSNSAMLATTKTNISETPLDSTSSSGTGKRCASADATNMPAIPIRTVPLCGSRANARSAAASAAKPPAQTGAIRARSRGGMPALPLTGLGLPAPNGDPAPDAVDARDDGAASDKGDQDCMLHPPLQHFQLPLGLTPGRRDSLSCGRSAASPKGVNRVLCVQTSFGEGAARPGELVQIPAVELCERDAVPGGVHEPAAPDIDAGMVDLCGLRLAALGAEEDHVARLEVGEADPLRRR